MTDTDIPKKYLGDSRALISLEDLGAFLSNLKSDTSLLEQALTTPHRVHRSNLIFALNIIKKLGLSCLGQFPFLYAPDAIIESSKIRARKDDPLCDGLRGTRIKALANLSALFGYPLGELRNIPRETVDFPLHSPEKTGAELRRIFQIPPGAPVPDVTMIKDAIHNPGDYKWPLMGSSFAPSSEQPFSRVLFPIQLTKLFHTVSDAIDNKRIDGPEGFPLSLIQSAVKETLAEKFQQISGRPENIETIINTTSPDNPEKPPEIKTVDAGKMTVSIYLSAAFAEIVQQAGLHQKIQNRIEARLEVLRLS
jgi:hypothetical protein